MPVRISRQVIPILVQAAIKLIIRDGRRPVSEEISRIIQDHPTRIVPAFEKSPQKQSSRPPPTINYAPQIVNHFSTIASASEPKIAAPIDKSFDEESMEESSEESMNFTRVPRQEIALEPHKVELSIEPTEKAYTESQPAVQPEEPKAKSIASGCLPCATGHLATCTGLLNESVRFAGNGLGDDEVITRVNMCLDELNAMERVDMRPEMVTQLAGWERELAEQVLLFSRSARHDLEGLANGGTKNDLEAVAAKMQTNRNEIAKTWFKNRLASLTPEEKADMQRKVMEKLTEVANG